MKTEIVNGKTSESIRLFFLRDEKIYGWVKRKGKKYIRCYYRVIRNGLSRDDIAKLGYVPRKRMTSFVHREARR